jgi:hypothetical protein
METRTLDWPLVISRNREALSRIVAALFVLAGLADGAVAQVLPRRVYCALLLVLRPAESAVRRLIVIAARGLMLKPRLSRPFPYGVAASSGAGAARVSAFCLLDPLKHFDLEDFNHSADAMPRNGYSSSFDEDFFALRAPLPPDEPVASALLCRRLNALKRALANLPREARRLVRWRARRDLLLQRKGPFRPVRLSVCRPGLPPGYRQRQLHEVDEVLRDCHYFAREALERPDTS